MLVIGGIGRAEGAVVGTFIVVFFDQVLITLRAAPADAHRPDHASVVLYLRNGLFGIKAQFRTLARQEEERTPLDASGERRRNVT